jgi:N-acetyl-anhydromuramyl-L-alanine amidase AmpD
MSRFLLREFDRFQRAAKFRATVGRRIDLVVIHTTENETRDGVADAVAAYFARGERDVSSHYVIGPDVTIWCVPEKDVAWAAPGANHNGIQLELVGQAAYTAAQWALPAQRAVLTRAAWIAACVCRRYVIPDHTVGVEGLLAGERGITTHAAVSAAFHKSTHWDPGPGFDLEAFAAAVRRMRLWGVEEPR